jgi:hypothetical protein
MYVALESGVLGLLELREGTIQAWLSCAQSSVLGARVVPSSRSIVIVRVESSIRAKLS